MAPLGQLAHGERNERVEIIREVLHDQVQLAKSERANDNGKEVTQFQLDMLYNRPDAALVRRVPLAVSVR